MRAKPILVMLLLCVMRLSPLAAADRWPEWRGSGGQGHATATNLPVRWSKTRNIAWQTPIPGRGWSTPVVDNGQVWVTTAIDVPATPEEADRRRRTSTNSQPLTISQSVSLRAVGLDLRTGQILRDVEILSERDPQMIHVKNSYATPTPVLEDGRLYCHYGASGMGCLDVASGEVLWTNRDLRVKLENGPGSSPILWNDLVILHCDGIDTRYITALDKDTGRQVWRTARTGTLNPNPQLKKSYATPLITNVQGKPQLISPAADWVYGYDPLDGRELWKVNYGVLGFSNAARPVVGHGLAFICTGYMKSELLAIQLDGDPQIAWRFKRQVPNVSSPLLVGDELYFAGDNGIATCLDARSGEMHWAERIGKRFWASPLCADGKIYFLADDGTTTVIEPGTTFQRLAVNQLGGILYAGAAAVDGALILRTDAGVYCIKPD